MNKIQKVFVGLSGGVDSAVSAVLLKEAGYEVTGVFIKVWSPDFLPCTWRDERRDAMRVAIKLGIPFLFFDFEEEYKRGVADYMIDEYKNGRTPNPDVLCNREIKFGAFWKKAKEMGADFIATGHYAQIHLTPAPLLDKERGEGERFLTEGKDREKDQSYFLWTLTQDDLSHVLFPIGHLEKSKVRQLAKKFDIPVSEKKDSQGICFLGDVNLEDFLSHFIEASPGNVLNNKGEVVGQHNGALYYTLGERHGFEVTEKETNSKPFYVIAKDINQNTITVSNNPVEITSHSSKEICIEKVNWINEPHRVTLWGRVRYRQKKFKVNLEENKVIFSEPQTAANGQSIVFYLPADSAEGEEDVCLGGGIIA